MPCIVVNYLGKKGGGSLYAYEITRGLENNGCDAVAIIPSDIENMKDWKSLKKTKLIILDGYGNSRISLIRSALRLIGSDGNAIREKCRDLDICCVYVPMIQPLTLLVNRLFRQCKMIATLHDPAPHKGAGIVYKTLCSITTRKADEVVVLSDTFVEYTVNHYGISRANVHVIPLGVFDQYKRLYNKESRIPYDERKTNFLFFGRIAPYKGLEVLARAYKKLSAEYYNISLTIAGSGDFSNYSSLYNGLRNVRVINRWIKDDEVYSFFCGPNIVTLLPYTQASQSGVIPVAMSCNSLVICSAIGGMVEQVESGRTGLTVIPNDEDSLYQTMKEIVEHGVSQTIVNNARAYIESFSWDKLADHIVQIALQKCNPC